MSWSLGEVQALATKAARGVGFPWGLAEEAGFAVRWLQAHSLPGATALAEYLTWREENRESATAACPLLQGARICDASAEFYGALPFDLSDLAFPLLLLPFAASSAETLDAETPLTLTWTDVEFQFHDGAIAGRFDESALLDRVMQCRLVSGMAADLAPCAPASRVPASAKDAIRRLDVFAARTYAPASERSRLTGAGAGTTDQD